MSPLVLTRSHKINRFIRASFCKLPVFVIGGFFLFFSFSAQAVTGDYNKPVNGTLAASEWNNLINDFVAKSGARLDGYFSINTATSSSYALDINGALRATNFSGAYTGTLNAGNISAGTFGANTGGGNYNFLGNLGIGIGTSTPNSAITLGNSRWISALNSAGTGYVNMFRVNANDEIEVGGALNIGQFQFPADSGFNTFVDMPVTNSSASGTIMGYTMKVDGDNILNVYSESNGAGGVQNRRIGIGTSTPRFTLDVAGIINASALYVNGSPYIGSQWTTQGTSIYYNTGNVGIGITNPAGKLHATYNASPIKFTTADYNEATDTGSGLWVWNTGSTSRIQALKNAESVVSILALNDLGGNVGIGTTSPASVLDVNGLIKMRSSTITANEDVINKGYLDSALASSSATIITQIATSSLWQGSLTGNIWSNNTGNVGIGTTTPGSTLDVIGDISYSAQSAIYPRRKSVAADWYIGKWDGGSNINNALGTSGDRAFQIGYWGTGGTFTPNIKLSAGGGNISYINSGNVGIGTSTPLERLEVNGTVLATKLKAGTYGNDRIEIYNRADNVSVVKAFSSELFLGSAYNGISFQGSSDNTLMKLTDAGNLGLGTTNPTAKLYVNGTSIFNDISTFTQPVVVGTPILDPHAATKSYVDSLLSGGTAAGSFDTLNVIGTTTLATTKGNVGIGVTNPAHKLTISASTTNALVDINQTSAWSGTEWALSVTGYTNLNGFRINAADGIRALHKVNAGGQLGFSTQGDDPITFTQLAASERMRIAPGGNVGIGTTIPTSKIHVYGTNPNLTLEDTGGAPGVGIQFKNLYSGATYTGSITSSYLDKGMVFTAPRDINQGGFRFKNYAGSEVFVINTLSGNVGIGSIFTSTVTAGSKLSVVGNTAIGTNYATSSAPANGLIVEGSVGIGTTTPGTRLTVVGSGNYSIDAGNYRVGNVAAPVDGNDAVTKSYMDSAINSATSSITLWGGATSGNIWNLNSGNVGIGTTNPTYKFQSDASGVAGLFKTTGNTTDAMYVQSTSGSGYSTIGFLNSSNSAVGSFGYANPSSGGPFADSVFFNSNNKKLNFSTNNGANAHLTIDTTGNVGIGTTNPGANKLNVAGNTYIGGTLTASSSITVNNGDITVTKSGSYANISNYTYSDIAWQGPRIAFNRFRGTASAATAAVAGDTAGWFDFFAYDGAASQRVGMFGMYIDGTVSSGVTPGRFVISTTNTSGASVNRITAYSNDNITMATSGGNVGIGTTTLPSKVALSGGNIFINDAVITSATPKAAVTKEYLDSSLTAFNTENNLWKLNGSSLYSSSTSWNVGIGTTAPNGKLQVSGTRVNTIDVASSIANIGGFDVYTRFGSLNGTPNYGSWIQVSRDSDNLAFPLFLNPIGGNVAVGTTTAPQKLSVAGNIQGSGDLYLQGGAIQITSINGRANIYQSAGTSLSYWNGSSVIPGVVLNNQGNVGIGVTNPSYALDISNNNILVGSDNVANTRTNGQYKVFRLLVPNTSASDAPLAAFVSVGGAISYGGGTSLGSIATSLRFHTAPTINQTGENVRMIIDGGGNVGIGTTTPNSILSVSNGNTFINDAVITSATPKAAITKEYLDSSLTAFNTETNLWKLNGSNLYSSSTSWNVGIGTTTPSSRLEVSQGSITLDNNFALRLRAADGSAYNSVYNDTGSNLILNAPASGDVYVRSNSNHLARFSNTGEVRLGGTNVITDPKVLITSSGNVGIGTSTPFAPLTIQQKDDSSGFRLIGYSDPTTIFSFYIGGGGANNPRFNSTKSLVFEANQAVYFRGYSGGVFINNDNNQLVSLAAGGGNVGVGTTTPSSKLFVSGGNAFINDAVITSATPKAAITKEYLDSSLTAFNSENNLWKLNGSNLYSSSTNWNVGIGTTAPAAKLHVSAGDIYMDPGYKIGWDAGTEYIRRTAGADGFAIGTQGNDRLVVNTVGYVGIGTSSPSAKLEVSGGTTWLKPNETGATGTALSLGRFADSPGSFLDIITNDATSDAVDIILNRWIANFNFKRTYSSGNGNVMSVLSNYSSGTNLSLFNDDAGGNVVKVKLDTNGSSYLNGGSFGVGTTAPQGKMEIAGTSVNSGNSDTVIISGNSVSTGFYNSLAFRQNSQNTGARITSGNNSSYRGFLGFETSRQTALGHVTAEAMRIDGFGNIGIGTTTPGTRLTVIGSGNYSIDAGNYRIGNLAAPVAQNDAVTKSYLDSAINTATSSLVSGSGTDGRIPKWNPDGKSIGNGSLLETGGDLSFNSVLSTKKFFATSANSNEYLGAPSKYNVNLTLGGASTSPWAIFDGKANTSLNLSSPFSLPLVLEVDMGTDSFHPSYHNLFILGWRDPMPTPSSNNGATIHSYKLEVRSVSDGLWYTSADVSGVNQSLPFYMSPSNANGGYFNAVRLTIREISGSSWLNTLAYFTEIGMRNSSGDAPWEGVGALGILGGNLYGNVVSNSSIQATTMKLTNLNNNFLPYHSSDSIGLVDSNIYYNGTNVGIGTTSPGTKLTVVGSGNYSIDAGNYRIGNIAAPVSGNDAVTKSYMDSAISSATSSITLWGGATTGNIWALNSGNVGIGTTNPGYKLDINGSVGIGTSGTSNNTISFARPYDGSKVVTVGFNGSTEINEFRTQHTGGNGYFTWFTSSTERMRLDKDGNLGIGSSNPTGALDIYKANVSANVKIRSFSDDAYLHLDSNLDGLGVEESGLILSDNGVGKWQIYKNYSNDFKVYDYTRGGNTINIADNGSMALMEAGGNISIGTTTATEKLTIYGGPDAISLRTNGLATKFILSTNWTASSSDFFGLRNSTATAPQFVLTLPGDVGIGTTTPYSRLSVSGGNIFINDAAITSGTPKAAITKEYFDSSLTAFNSLNNLWKLNGSSLYSSSTSWNVGIGTAAPSGRLTVSGDEGDARSVSIDSREVKFRGDGVAHISIFGPDTGKPYLSFVNTSNDGQTGATGTELMILNSTGSLGIGTVPGARLDINGSLRANNSVTFSMLSGGGNRVTSVDNNGVLGNSNIYLNGNNVGVGTSTPSTKLHVFGDNPAGLKIERQSVGGNSNIQFTNPGGSMYAGLSGSSNFGIGTEVDLSLAHLTVLKTSGNVGIGTTDPGIYKLFVNGNTNIAGSLNVTGTTTASAFIGPLTGTMNAGNVSSGAFGVNTGGGNYSFPGYLGIGTSDPSGMLSIRKYLSLGDNQEVVNISHDNSYNLKLYQNFSAGGVMQYNWVQNIAGVSNNVMTFRQGSVGIGTTNPTQKLDVYGKSNFADILYFGGTSNAQMNWGTVGGVNYGMIFSSLGAKPIGFGTGGASNINMFIANGGNVGIGTTDPGAYRLKVSGDVAITGTLQTQTGSDFAEEFSVKEELEPGTVVVMDDNGHKSVKPCSGEYDKKVVGIVSDNPSIIAGKVESGKKAVVAMMGVVTVKASSINGSIEKGDLITTSDIPGYAMKAESFRPGTIIGKALEDLSGRKGEIKVLVNLQ